MLRASCSAMGEEIDAVAVVQGEVDAVPFGRLLVAFVDATIGNDRHAAATARSALAAAAGDGAVVDAAAVIANFEMMTRLADATGARATAERAAELYEERARLGLDRFESARHGIADA